MNNLNTLSEQLFSTLDDLKNGKIKREDAKVMKEIAGTLINNAKTQLEAFKITKGIGDQAELFGVKSLGPSPDIENQNVYDQKMEFSISKGFKNVAECMAALGQKFEYEFRTWRSKQNSRS